MMNISSPIGAAGVERYHKKEYANAKENYFTRGEKVHSFWHGKLAAKWGLKGAVGAEQFGRLARGLDPHTGEVLIAAVDGKRDGVKHHHRAAWDLTLSAPKSVSITAIIGEREEVYEAHRAAVREALSAIERYASAHLGGTRGQEATRNFAVACFEHDTARPVGGDDWRRDPQLHTHSVAFNMTLASDKVRSLDSRELFRAQRYATAVYRASLAAALHDAGYTIEIDAKTGAPEIAGYTREYLEAASSRSAQIDDNLARFGLERRAATTKKAVRIGRAAKRDVDPKRVRAAQLALAREFGNQHARVIALAAYTRVNESRPRDARREGVKALRFALETCTTRSATTSVRDLLTVALKAGLGRTTERQIKEALQRAHRRGDVVVVGRTDGPDFRVTTREMIELERASIETCLAGRNDQIALLPGWDLKRAARSLGELSPAQRKVFLELAGQRDTVYALQGLAGVGKTRLLGTLAAHVRKQGYEVVGLAPSGVAAAQLTAGGIAAQTMQMFLQTGRQSRQPHVFIVDETSLASTRMVHEFLKRLRPVDRVILVGDTAQHESVEAGRMFAQLQEAGIRRSVLDEIRRQKDPELREAVTKFARQDVAGALAGLPTGQIREVRDQAERFRAIAEEYARHPEGTLVVAPTHAERREITTHIRKRLRADGRLGRDAKVTALDPRNDYAEPELRKAYTYREGDVVRYRVGAPKLGIAAGSYATVLAVDATRNRLAVTTSDGRTIAYDPSRLAGVEIYQERVRSFAIGDRVVVTLGSRAKRIPKCTTGGIIWLAGTEAKVRLDDGRTTTMDLAEWRHLDHAYVLTSYASQSLTTSRVIVHVDTAHAETMINERFGYVAASRAVDEAVIFTDRADLLAEKLGREYRNVSALEALVDTVRELNERVRQQAEEMAASRGRTPAVPKVRKEEKERAATPEFGIGH